MAKLKEQSTEQKDISQLDKGDFDDIVMIREKDIQQHQHKRKKQEIKERIAELKDELEKIRKDLEVARRNEADTGPIYKDKQNVEKEIAHLKDILSEYYKSPGEKTDSEKNIVKAALLSRQGIVNIRPPQEVKIVRNN